MFFKTLRAERKFFMFLYIFISILSVITEYFMSKDLIFDIFENLPANEAAEKFKYQVVYTKLLSLMEFAFLANFYFSKNINNIVQIRTVKIIDAIIWVFLSIQMEFDGAIVCYLVLFVILFCLIGHISKIEYNLVIKEYNRKVSIDPKLISLYILLQIIDAIQNATKIFFALRIFVTIKFRFFDRYKIYAIAKLPSMVALDVCIKRESNYNNRVRFQMIFSGLFCVFSVYYMEYIFEVKSIFTFLLDFIIEVLALIQLLLLIVGYYITNKLLINPKVK